MGSATFNFTGGWQKWAVPNKVTDVEVILNGAGVPSGKHGGKVSGRLKVKDGDVLWIAVGHAGHANSGHNGGAGGWPAGGDGGDGVNHAGGEGGAGYTAIRRNSSSGTVLAVAAGAGGQSGDGGDGGRGGPDTGQSGHHFGANLVDNVAGEATGGTQNQGGFRGTTLAGNGFAGHDASRSILGKGGHGGGTNRNPGYGGGGGGAGFHAGGGGHGGTPDTTNYPAGGGAGGSNYDDHLTSSVNDPGGGHTGNGDVTLLWSDPAPADQRPNAPHMEGPSKGTRLKDYDVVLRATVTDPDHTVDVRMRVIFSNNDWKSSFGPFFSDYVKSGDVARLHRAGLPPNTHQRARIWSQDRAGQLSLNYASTDYFTNYAPTEPTLLTPADGANVTTTASTVFDWTPHDPDGQKPSRSQLRYWVVTGDGSPDYHTVTVRGSASTWTVGPDTFKSNRFYRWQVRTRDPLGLWGPWSQPRRFYGGAATAAPDLISPIKNVTVNVDKPVTLRWRFRDPNPGNHQVKADIRFRASVSNSWITLFGTTGTPGTDRHWTRRVGTFQSDVLYEWQARTYDNGSGGTTPSDWSDSAFFRARSGIDRRIVVDVPDDAEVVNELGCGTNKAFLAVRGGHRLLGRLDPIINITYGRVRDDISKAVVRLPISGAGQVCQLAKLVRSWTHEVVIYRETPTGMVRQWEGPVTRVEYGADYVEIEAQDVMVVLFRRIMKAGYSDAYPNNQSVVARAAQLIMNGLADDDPNILRWLTLFEFDDDAQESRVRKDWQSTIWAEVDDMAANAGLDYVVAGRRIILFDTHRPIGRLPMMRSQHFTAPPVVSEYGMSLATLYGVTDGSGVHGQAHRDDSATGPVEFLVSAFGENPTNPRKARSREALRKLESTFDKQARRGIAARWPTPVAVRVPDNTSLVPSTPVPLEALVPGVWIPLQAEHVCRSVSQWQKLDSVTVTQAADQGETVQVVMSPAPDNGADPDAELATSEADTSG